MKSLDLNPDVVPLHSKTTRQTNSRISECILIRWLELVYRHYGTLQ